MVSLRRRFLFVHVPKTGGNSIQSVLAPYADDKVVISGHQDGRERFEVSGPYTPKKHATMADYAKRLSAEQLAGLFKFACVRDPFTRAMSFYFSPNRWYRQRDGAWQQEQAVWSREAFVAALAKLPPMIDYLGGMADDVIRFESFAADARRVLRRLEIAADLPHLNAGPVRDYSDYYDAELKGLVRARYAADFATYYP